jgi:hypothetical protein
MAGRLASLTEKYHNLELSMFKYDHCDDGAYRYLGEQITVRERKELNVKRC